MKYALLFIICCAGGGIGWCFAERYKEKRRFYGDLLRLVNECGIYIKYTRPPIAEIFGQCESYAGAVLRETVKCYYSTLTFELPKGECYCHLEGLKPDERQEINDFFDGLGKTHSDGQEKHLLLFKERFSERYREAEKNEKQNGTNMVKLGLLGGIFVCILLL